MPKNFEKESCIEINSESLDLLKAKETNKSLLVDCADKTIRQRKFRNNLFKALAGQENQQLAREILEATFLVIAETIETSGFCFKNSKSPDEQKKEAKIKIANRCYLIKQLFENLDMKKLIVDMAKGDGDNVTATQLTALRKALHGNPYFAQHFLAALNKRQQFENLSSEHTAQLKETLSHTHISAKDKFERKVNSRWQRFRRWFLRFFNKKLKFSAEKMLEMLEKNPSRPLCQSQAEKLNSAESDEEESVNHLIDQSRERAKECENGDSHLDVFLPKEKVDFLLSEASSKGIKIKESSSFTELDDKSNDDLERSSSSFIASNYKSDDDLEGSSSSFMASNYKSDGDPETSSLDTRYLLLNDETSFLSSLDDSRIYPYDGDFPIGGESEDIFNPSSNGSHADSGATPEILSSLLPWPDISPIPGGKENRTPYSLSNFSLWSPTPQKEKNKGFFTPKRKEERNYGSSSAPTRLF